MITHLTAIIPKIVLQTLVFFIQFIKLVKNTNTLHYIKVHLIDQL